MSNYFYSLPIELQIMIYEYDPTYSEFFEKVLDEVSPFRLFQLLSGDFLIVNLKTNLYWTCDSLENPSWMGVYRYNNLDFLTELFKNNHLVSITNKKRQYFENNFL